MATKREKNFLVSLDKRTAIVEETLIRLETNHLVHLQKQIDRVDTRVWAILGSIALQLVAIILFLLN
tara:strand:+ start:158 stop:358 length:201 start_codon:yes stop_codon:yes gene_type:complete